MLHTLNTLCRLTFLRLIFVYFLGILFAYPATSQTLATGEEFKVPYIRLIVSLILLCLLAYIILAYIKRLSAGDVTGRSFKAILKNSVQQQSRIDFIERKVLSNQCVVMLISVDDDKILITKTSDSLVVTPLGKTDSFSDESHGQKAAEGKPI